MIRRRSGARLTDMIFPYLTFFRAGFAVPACCQARGALLPHHFTLATRPEGPFGGLLSVALSVGSRRPGVTWHRALWSPAFPRHRPAERRGGKEWVSRVRSGVWHDN